MVRVFLVIAFAALTSIGVMAQEVPAKQQKPDLAEAVKWAVWHEGCRIYAEDNSIGDPEEIRECVVDVYAKNDEAKELVRAASPGALMAALRTAGRDIPGERHLSEFIEYACKHEHLLDRFYDMENAGDYEGMRSLYYDTFKTNENARNLLAAVSNEAMCDLVNVLR